MAECRQGGLYQRTRFGLAKEQTVADTLYNGTMMETKGGREGHTSDAWIQINRLR